MQATKRVNHSVTSSSHRTDLAPNLRFVLTARTPLQIGKPLYPCDFRDSQKRNYWPNFAALQAKDQVKFVIRDRTDYDWAKDVIAKYDLEDGPHLLISPVFGVMDYQALAAWILQDGLKARMQLQHHKFIWHPDARGV